MSEHADLLTFLRARLDEDERVAMAAARAANTDTWIDGAEGSVLGIGGDMHLRGAVNSIDDIGPHVVRWDPARALAEVEVKRKLLDYAEGLLQDNPEDTTPRWLAKLLAQPYADHPDYRDEWRPGGS
jgi:hypothetical protein